LLLISKCNAILTVALCDQKTAWPGIYLHRGCPYTRRCLFSKRSEKKTERWR